MKPFADNLKALRMESYTFSHNRSALAKRIGVDEDTLQAWEEGHEDPTLAQFVKIAQVFDCSADRLLGCLSTICT